MVVVFFVSEKQLGRQEDYSTALEVSDLAVDKTSGKIKIRRPQLNIPKSDVLNSDFGCNSLHYFIKAVIVTIIISVSG